MSEKRTLLADVRAPECGHRFQCWTVEFDDGRWELHFSAPCDKCEALAVRTARIAFPGRKPVITD
jgi:hypothetical protein